MKALARRIERATRNHFLTSEDSEQGFGIEAQTDRDKIWNRMKQLQTEAEAKGERLDYWTARRLATEEWLENLLLEHCLKTPTKPK